MNNGVRVEFKIPQILLDRLDSYVEKQFETRSTIIRQAIKEYIGKQLELGDKE